MNLFLKLTSRNLTRCMSLIALGGLFSRVGGASGIRYQWRKNAMPIFGATEAVLRLPSVRLEDAGNYSVVVETSQDILASQPARLDVSIPVNGAFSAVKSTSHLHLGAELMAPIGRSYAIEKTEDFITWTPVTTLTNLTGVITLPILVNESCRGCFYRAVMVR